MRWNVEFLESAIDALEALPEKFRFQISRKIAALDDNPFARGAERLQVPEELYRLRSGDYRIVYRVDRASRLIEIVRIGHRKDVYRGIG